MKYLSRVADKMLQERLEAFGAVLIEGPKWTGKTTTAEQQAKSVIKLQNPDKANEYLATARTKPSLLLKGEQPRLIDEWQDAPMLWDAVRTAVDDAGGVPGQYYSNRKQYCRQVSNQTYRNRAHYKNENVPHEFMGVLGIIRGNLNT